MAKTTTKFIEWGNVWIVFAAFSMVITILFAIFFKHEHKPEEVVEITH